MFQMCDSSDDFVVECDDFWHTCDTNYVPSIFSTSDPLQSDGCRLSVLLSFHISTMPILCFGNLASMEASIDYMALRIFHIHSLGNVLSFGTSPVKVGRNGCKVFL